MKIKDDISTGEYVIFTLGFVIGFTIGAILIAGLVYFTK